MTSLVKHLVILDGQAEAESGYCSRSIRFFDNANMVRAAIALAW